MQTSYLIDQLPVEITRGIGRAISAHALLEHTLTSCIGILTGLGNKEMRLVLAEPRSEMRLQIIKSLIKIHKLDVAVPAVLTTKTLKGAREERNLLAHGIWIKSDRGYAVIQTAGNWPTKSDKGPRKIQPAAVIKDAARLLSLTREFAVLRDAVETLRERIQAARAASPRKPL